MEGHDIVVIGASAGGVQALIELISRLPADLPASVFVVLHMATAAPSALPLILSRHSALPLGQAVEGESIVPGRVYVARPDYHLLIEDGHVRLGHGPKEHHTRPALDPLFRTAAEVYGRRVIGVVLTGARSNGALGLLAVKEHGGVAMVQQPGEALWPSMPVSAMRTVGVDYVLPLAELAPKLVELILDPPAEETVAAGPGPGKEAEAMDRGGDPKGDSLTELTCPECGGVMRLLPPNDLTLFRCSVGHTLSAEELLEAQADQLETALWSAVRIAEQQTALARILGRPDPVEDPAAPPTLPLAAGSEETAAAIRCILEGGGAVGKRTC